MEGIFDEVAPALGHALGAVDGPHGDAREDLHQGIFWEAVHRAPLGAGAVHAAAAAAARRLGGGVREQAAKRSDGQGMRE